jgi:hypothetical protein
VRLELMLDGAGQEQDRGEDAQQQRDQEHPVHLPQQRNAPADVELQEVPEGAEDPVRIAVMSR